MEIGDRRVIMAGFGVYLAILVMATTAIAALDQIFVGGGFLPKALAAAFLALAISFLLRRARITGILRVALVSLAGLWFLSVVLVPESVVAAMPLLPRKFISILLTSVGKSYEAAVPVASTREFVLVASTAIFIAGVVSEAAAAARWPIAASVPWIAVLAFSSAMSDQPSGWRLMLFLAGMFALLFVSGLPEMAATVPQSRSDRSLMRKVAPGAAFLSLGAILSAYVLPGFVPGYGSDSILGWPPEGPPSQTTISPLVQIRPRLNSLRPQTLFTVKPSVLPEDPRFYWRLLALDTFDGVAWKSSAEYPKSKGPLNSRYRVGGKTITVTQTYQIERLGGLWIPAAYQPVSIQGIEAGMDPLGSALVKPSGLFRGDGYTAVSRLPLPTADDLKRAPATRGLDKYRRISGISDDVREVAESITKGAATPYEKVLAITTHLRRFTYDENVEAGHSDDQVLEFLTETQAGYCEQFAGSMAVLVRAVGIPARVAVGFLQGDYDSGASEFVVTTEHAHAWAEVFFEGIGWIPFEPTPRAMAVPPTYSVAPLAAGGVPAGDEIEPEAGEESPPSPATEDTGPVEDPQAPRRSSSYPFGLIWLAAAVITLQLVIVTGVYKELRSRLRFRNANDAVQAARASYSHLEDTLTDAARARLFPETAAEYVEAVSSQLSLATSAPEVIVATFHHAVFGAPVTSPSPGDVAVAAAAAVEVRREVWRRSSPLGKIALLFSPRSLFRRGIR